MFFKNIKMRIKYLEDLMEEKDKEIYTLANEIQTLKEIKNINIVRCECGHEEGLETLTIRDSDGYTCDYSLRNSKNEFKEYVGLRMCPKCGIVKAVKNK